MPNLVSTLIRRARKALLSREHRYLLGHLESAQVQLAAMEDHLFGALSLAGSPRDRVLEASLIEARAYVEVLTDEVTAVGVKLLLLEVLDEEKITEERQKVLA
jgi:hypothetical protein